MNSHTNLIERLKRRRVREDTLGRETVYFVNPDGPEAAQAISTLTAEVEELRQNAEGLLLCVELGDPYGNIKMHMHKFRATLTKGEGR